MAGPATSPLRWPVGFLAVITLAVMAAPLAAALLGQGAEAVDLLARLEPPSQAHPLGTDDLGRDLLLRLLYGGQISLLVGFAGAALAGLIGAGVGLWSGYAGGAVDAALMRFTDAVIALPLLPLLIVLAALDPSKLGLGAWSGTGAGRIVLITALFGWTTTARLMRASVLRLRRLDFVTAAIALGAGPWRIALRHLLPNAAGPLVVTTVLAVGRIILAESVLSFLGLGVQAPTPSWGNMLTGAQDLLLDAPRLAVLPGLMILLTVVACNALGDGLQTALEPHGTR